MAINTNISAFAQNNYDSTAIQSENAPSGSVIITETVLLLMVYTIPRRNLQIYSIRLLKLVIQKIMASKHEVQLRQEYILFQALERLQLRQLGAIVVAGVAVVAGTWLYNTITEWLSNSQARTIAKIRAKIPSRLRKENGDVDLGKFNEKVGGKKFL